MNCAEVRARLKQCWSRIRRLEIFNRILGFAELRDFVVQMYAGNSSGVSHRSYNVTLFNFLRGFDIKFA